MFECQKVGARWLCRFPARLNAATCMQWDHELVAKIRADPAPVVFDMQGVEFVASVFIRLCLVVARDVGVDQFSVAHCSLPVENVFRMAGLEQQLAQLGKEKEGK